MKLLRIGVIVLVIGVSLLVATYVRSHTVDSGSIGGAIMAGPFVFEPRTTVITLKEVDPKENLTLAVINELSWSQTQDIREVTPAFVLSGLRESDTIIFKISVRGLYYVVVMTEKGELVNYFDLVVQQRGFADDLLWASGTLVAVGVGIVVVQVARSLKLRENNGDGSIQGDLLLYIGREQKSYIFKLYILKERGR